MYIDRQVFKFWKSSTTNEWYDLYTYCGQTDRGTLMFLWACIEQSKRSDYDPIVEYVEVLPNDLRQHVEFTDDQSDYEYE